MGKPHQFNLEFCSKSILLFGAHSLAVQPLRTAGDPPWAAVQLLLRLLPNGFVSALRGAGGAFLQEPSGLCQVGVLLLLVTVSLNKETFFFAGERTPRRSPSSNSSNNNSSINSSRWWPRPWPEWGCTGSIPPEEQEKNSTNKHHRSQLFFFRNCLLPNLKKYRVYLLLLGSSLFQNRHFFFFSRRNCYWYLVVEVPFYLRPLPPCLPPPRLITIVLYVYRFPASAKKKKDV